MKNIERIILTIGLLALPVAALAQNDDPQKKSEIKVGKLDVIYEEEEFKGIEIDQEEEDEIEQNLYQAPFFVRPDDDDDEGTIQAFTLDDDGVDSEEDIIFEAFDTMAIHLPKLDPTTITEPIMLTLPKFSWPTPETARASSHFGPRRRRFHYGLDLAQPTGEPIYAAFDGVVRISKRNRSYGNLVIIHHANGLETYYAHMSKREVVAGQYVKSGELIGLCGNTGRSFGSHLHFEIRYMGNAINPENVMDCETHNLINQTLTLTSDSFRKVRKGGKVGKGSSASSSGWYRVRSGDTLEKIARRNGTTVKRLCQLNGISSKSTLRVGQKLKVNGSAAKSSKTSKTSTSKTTTTSSAKTTTTSTANSANDQPTAQQSSARTHTVRKGETLYSISKRNGKTVQQLRDLNGLSKDSKLHVGQKLKLE